MLRSNTLHLLLIIEKYIHLYLHSLWLSCKLNWGKKAYQKVWNDRNDTSKCNKLYAILDHSGCYNKNIIYGILVISHSSGNWELQEQSTHRFSDEDLLLDPLMAISLLCSYMMAEARDLSGVSFVWALMSFLRATL
jgi:hypothetical protein